MEETSSSNKEEEEVLLVESSPSVKHSNISEDEVVVVEEEEEEEEIVVVEEVKKEKEEEKEKEKEKEEEEEEEDNSIKWKKMEGDYYDIESYKEELKLRKGYKDSMGLELYYSFGFENFKRYNIHYIESNVLMFAQGNFVQFLNLEDMTQRYVQTVGGYGIGAISTHPSLKYFAVAEKGIDPGIFIYNYPSLKLYKILLGGTTKVFSNVCFSHTGTKLASVGADPDYMLTVWDWHEEKILLRTKAFSQEVFKVSFSPQNEGQLTTSGTGHIRFWKMAHTFTGLKLQGELGKFGRVELSDIAGYIELPDGKVISGIEVGNLLLWDGNFIKCEITQKGGKPCHDGMIEVICLEGNRLITAGVDGYVKIWDFDTIDAVDIDSSVARFEINPLEEIFLGENMEIKAMNPSLGDIEHRHWLIQNSKGSICKLDLRTKRMNDIFKFLAGSLASAMFSPNSYVIATTGEDGTVRLFDVFAQKSLGIRKFNNPGTFLCWVPLDINPTGRSLVVGFHDGVVRVLVQNKDELLLGCVLKPHNLAVTSITFSPNSKLVVTASLDKTIFFFRVDNAHSLSPLFFTNCSAGISSLSWRPDAIHLVAFCLDGTLAELTVPSSLSSESINTSATFEVSLDSKEIVLRRKVVTITYERVDTDNNENSIEGMPSSYSTKPKPQEKEKELRKESIEVIQESILAGQCLGDDKVILTYENNVSGLCLGSFEDHEKPIKQMDAFSSSSIHSLSYFSGNKELLFVGCKDGYVFALQLPSDLKEDPMVRWMGQLHDGNYGCVTCVSSSFDGAFVVTAGQDGNCFVLKNANAKPQKAGSSGIGIVVTESHGAVSDMCKDISSASHYSLQEAKLKFENDRKLEDAENKKAVARKRIENIRDGFYKIVRENEKRIPEERLSAEEWKVDADLKPFIEKEISFRKQKVYDEFSFDRERTELLLKKMKARYIDQIEVDLITLVGFKNSIKITTFGLYKLHPSVLAKINLVHSIIVKEQENRALELQKLESMHGAGEDEEKQISLKRISQQSVDEEYLEGSASHLLKAEERKKMRLKRQQEWEEYETQKPTDKDEDPDDLEKIRDAKKHMGDYPLKMAKDYKVPDNQRVNAEKKRRQKILLEESIYLIKKSFNKRILALRDLKIELIERIRKWNKRIMEVNDMLNVEEMLFMPEIYSQEFPEKRLEFTNEDVQAFAQKKADQDKKGARAGQLGFLDDSKNAKRSEKHEDIKQSASTAGDSKRNPSGPPGPFSGDKKGWDWSQRKESVLLSELEDMERAMLHCRLQFEKETLIKKIESTTTTFDNALFELRREKFKLEGDLKMADIKMLVLFKELGLLKEFERQDQTLASKQKSKRAEKAEFVQKITEYQEKLGTKVAEIEEVMGRFKDIETEFNLLVGENNPHTQALHKIYEKSVRRTKTKTEHDAQINFSDDEDDDFEDYDSYEDYSSEEEEEEAAPSGCDKAVFNHVLELREKRFALEDQKNEMRKTVEIMKKEIETLIKKEKIVESSLIAIQNEIQDFQLLKQQRLNELHIIITLRLHQLQCIEHGEFPEDLSSTVVFTNTGRNMLHRRIHALSQELGRMRHQYKDLVKHRNNLSREKLQKKASMKDLELKCTEVQMLKFGQLIDIESLDRMSVNKKADELREKIDYTEKVSLKEKDGSESRIKASKNYLTELTRSNTERLSRLGEFTRQRHQLEESLDISEASMTAEFSEAEREERLESVKLMKVAKLQKQEIEALKAEINVLSRKAGTVHHM